MSKNLMSLQTFGRYTKVIQACFFKQEMIMKQIMRN